MWHSWFQQQIRSKYILSTRYQAYHKNKNPCFQEPFILERQGEGVEHNKQLYSIYIQVVVSTLWKSGGSKYFIEE